MRTFLKCVMAASALTIPAAGIATGINIHAATDTPVTTTVADMQGGYQLRVESDLRGPYANTRTQAVSSIIQSGSGDWVLDAGTSNSPHVTSRSVFFDLTEPTSPDNPVPPFPSAYVPSHLIAKCHLVNVSFMTIPAGTTVQCPGGFRFTAPNGLTYRLSFQPDNFPEVNRMNVTCNAADSHGCKLWTIAPSGTIVTGTDPNPKNINKLVQIDPGSDAVIADLGDYYISFAISVAR